MAKRREEFLGEVRAKLNASLGGLVLADAAVALDTAANGFQKERWQFVGDIVESLREQVAANRGERLLMAGTANLALTAEDFGGSIFPVLEAIEEQVTLLKLFGEMEPDQHGLSTSIGSENSSFGLSETSVLASGYTSSGGEFARVGVLGPTRMDYPNNMAAVRAVARYLSRLLGED